MVSKPFTRLSDCKLLISKYTDCAIELCTEILVSYRSTYCSRSGVFQVQGTLYCTINYWCVSLRVIFPFPATAPQERGFNLQWFGVSIHRGPLISMYRISTKQEFNLFLIFHYHASVFLVPWQHKFQIFYILAKVMRETELSMIYIWGMQAARSTRSWSWQGWCTLVILWRWMLLQTFSRLLNSLKRQLTAPRKLC